MIDGRRLNLFYWTCPIWTFTFVLEILLLVCNYVELVMLLGLVRELSRILMWIGQTDIVFCLFMHFFLFDVWLMLFFISFSFRYHFLWSLYFGWFSILYFSQFVAYFVLYFEPIFEMSDLIFGWLKLQLFWIVVDVENVYNECASIFDAPFVFVTAFSLFLRCKVSIPVNKNYWRDAGEWNSSGLLLWRF